MRNKPSIFGRILFPFVIGVWVQRQNIFKESGFLLLILLAILIFLLLIINYLYKLIKVYNHHILTAILISSFFLFFGLVCSKAHNNKDDFSYFAIHRANYFKISVASEPEQRGSILRFKARVHTAFLGQKNSPVTGNLMIALKPDATHPLFISYGKTYLVPARYKPINPPQNPGEFDYRAWLANQNIYQQAYVFPQEIIPLDDQKGNPIIRFSLQLRQQQVRHYRRIMRDDQAFAIASTLILGYRSDLDAATLAAYSKTGTIHALSVSGMHVGMIYFVLEFMLKWMDKKRVLKGLKLTLILSLIWCYTLLTGYSPSVLRSSVMLTFFILSKALKKDAGGYQALYLSAFFLLLYNPWLLWDTGFQLSYFAVLGLIYLQPKIESFFVFKWTWLQKLWSLISLSLAAQILTFPLSVYYFHQFPVYFILSNLFITIPVTLLMYSGIALLLFPIDWLGPSFEWLIIFMNRGLEKIASLPYPVVNGIWLSKIELVLLGLFMLCGFTAFSIKRRELFYLSILTLLCLQTMLVKDKITALQQHKVILFKMNKHQAAALINGKKALVITDLKPSHHDFKFHVQPALEQLHINQITTLPLK